VIKEKKPGIYAVLPQLELLKQVNRSVPATADAGKSWPAEAMALAFSNASDMASANTELLAEPLERDANSRNRQFFRSLP